MSGTRTWADDTLAGLLKRNAEQRPDAPAMREKTMGIWRTQTWSEYYGQVRDFALGLASLGFKRGDVLAVVGDNRPRLYAAQLAAMALGGVPAPLYQDAPAEELVYVLEHAEASVLVAEDQEQVDKILSIRSRLPKLRLVVYEDARGMFHYRDEMLRAFGAVEALGREYGASHPGLVEAEIAKARPDDVALICYTSGTTGKPKGAMLSHANLIASASAFLACTNLKPEDDWLAYLPMAWIGDAVYTLVLQMMVGFACNCPESPTTVQRDLRELGPSAFLAAPRIWENLLTQIQVKANDASWLKRRAFEFFRDRAIEAELLRTEGKPVPVMLRLALLLGEFLVYGPVRDQIGLRRARWCLTGGAPLGPDAFRFFRAFGINLKQVYGSTELAAFVSVQPDSQANPNTVGPPGPGIEVRIAEGGEVLVRGANVFVGYHKQSDATREAIDAEGWFHTGDAGFIDPQGHLAIIDRAKDVGKLEGGKHAGTPIAPQFIENKLKFSPYIGEAIAFGPGRSHVTAMVAIALDPVGSWAERRGLAYSGYQDLTQKPEVRALIREEIRRCNEGLLEATRVRRFLLLAKDFDADDAEVTRTRKLRRRVIAEKYKPVIEALYDGATETEIATEVTYEDGQRATVRAKVSIEDIHV
ncbi:MAG TPA: AMP-binding protein [Burkholderiales bacterium]|jgi:long-chain acyl-CoA synthetase|nr:AMP-binding protein [Burkholderiales bacterium]